MLKNVPERMSSYRDTVSSYYVYFAPWRDRGSSVPDRLLSIMHCPLKRPFISALERFALESDLLCCADLRDATQRVEHPNADTICRGSVEGLAVAAGT